MISNIRLRSSTETRGEKTIKGRERLTEALPVLIEEKPKGVSWRWRAVAWPGIPEAFRICRLREEMGMPGEWEGYG